MRRPEILLKRDANSIVVDEETQLLGKSPGVVYVPITSHPDVVPAIPPNAPILAEVPAAYSMSANLRRNSMKRKTIQR